MPDTNHTVLLEAVEARDELIERLAADLHAARSQAYSLATRVHNLTDGNEGGMRTLPWDLNYNGQFPADVTTRELDAIRAKIAARG